MFFDAEESLTRHRNKFCINSKYGNIDALNSEFEKQAQGRNLSLLGKKSKAEAFEPGVSTIKNPRVKTYASGYI